MINEYDIIKLKAPLPSKNLPLGAKGTVLIVYNEPKLPRAYEIEFLDEEGNTLAIVTLNDDEIEKV